MRSTTDGHGSAVILAGGRGTRLGPLTDETPKPMLPIDGRPFLEYLVRQLVSYDIRDIVLSCGYRGEAVRGYFGDGTALGVSVRYAHEDIPLGTGGALRLAAGLIADERFLLLNGDSICEVDCRQLLEAPDGDRLGAMTLTRVPDGRRFGTVELSSDGRVAAFRQNDPSAGPALINAGVYAIRRGLVDLIPSSGPVSLERDVLPGLVGRLAGVVSDGFFVDMGIPETYARLRADPGPLHRLVRRAGRASL